MKFKLKTKDDDVLVFNVERGKLGDRKTVLNRPVLSFDHRCSVYDVLDATLAYLDSEGLIDYEQGDLEIE